MNDTITIVDEGIQIDHADGSITFVDLEFLFESGLEPDDLPNLRYDPFGDGLSCENQDIYIQL